MYHSGMCISVCIYLHVHDYVCIASWCVCHVYIATLMNIAGYMCTIFKDINVITFTPHVKDITINYSYI